MKPIHFDIRCIYIYIHILFLYIHSCMHRSIGSYLHFFLALPWSGRFFFRKTRCRVAFGLRHPFFCTRTTRMERWASASGGTGKRQVGHCHSRNSRRTVQGESWDGVETNQTNPKIFLQTNFSFQMNTLPKFVVVFG